MRFLCQKTRFSRETRVFTRFALFSNTKGIIIINLAFFHVFAFFASIVALLGHPCVCLMHASLLAFEYFCAILALKNAFLARNTPFHASRPIKDKKGMIIVNLAKEIFSLCIFSTARMFF